MVNKGNWTQAHESKRNTLFNYFKKAHPESRVTRDNFIDKYKKESHTIIDNNKSWSDGTKEGLYFMIARY